MKRLTWLLVIASLAVNATLLAALAKRRPISNTPGQPESSAASSGFQNKAGYIDKAPPVIIAGEVAHTAPMLSRTLWERLASRDPATFAANLRAAGFSLGSMRGGIYALLRDLQTPERVKAVESLPLDPYWKAATTPMVSSEYAKEINRLWHERDRIMRSLFPEEQLAFTLRLQARYGRLPEDKLEKLAVLDRDYSEMRMQLMQSQSGLRMPWSTDQLSYLDLEKRKDVAAILTPQELEEYDLRASPTAASLQRLLVGFDPSEQEYRDIFRLRAPFDEKMRAGGAGFGMTPEAAEAQRQLSDQIKSALGEARYTAYERSTDAGVQSARGIAQRLNLPASTADAVFQLQREVREREAAIHGNNTQPAAQREAQLAALAGEAKQKLSALLTPRGADQYRMETGTRGLPILQRTDPPRR